MNEPTQQHPGSQHRTVKSYVLRQGRLTASQNHAIATLWPEYGINWQQQLLDMQQCFGRSAPLVFEIGFGMGASLVQQALAEPEKNFLGIEVHRPGVGTCLKEIAHNQLRNLKLLNCDAIMVLEHMIPDSSISRLQLYFPDPWHKKKHHKRRIVTAPFIALIYKKMCVGGQLHMATDWQPYAQCMHDVMQMAKGFSNMASPEAYLQRPAFRPVTKFERRGQKLGHGVWDLMYKKF